MGNHSFSQGEAMSIEYDSEVNVLNKPDEALDYIWGR
jgi:hypothetical protein